MRDVSTGLLEPYTTLTVTYIAVEPKSIDMLAATFASTPQHAAILAALPSIVAPPLQYQDPAAALAYDRCEGMWGNSGGRNWNIEIVVLHFRFYQIVVRGNNIN